MHQSIIPVSTALRHNLFCPRNMLRLDDFLDRVSPMDHGTIHLDTPKARSCTRRIVTRLFLIFLKSSFLVRFIENVPTRCPSIGG